MSSVNSDKRDLAQLFLYQDSVLRSDVHDFPCLFMVFVNNTSDREPGAKWFRPGNQLFCWRVVVGQLATLIADQNLTAETQFALAA